jgi:hypothetical protein
MAVCAIFQHRRQASRNRKPPALAGFPRAGFLGPHQQLALRQVHVSPPQREQLPAPAARLERPDDEPLQMRPRDVEQPGFLARLEPPIALGVLLPLDALGALDRVTRQVALADGPPEHRFDGLHELVARRRGEALVSEGRKEHLDRVLGEGVERRVAEGAPIDAEGGELLQAAAIVLAQWGSAPLGVLRNERRERQRLRRRQGSAELQPTLKSTGTLKMTVPAASGARSYCFPVLTDHPPYGCP